MGSLKRESRDIAQANLGDASCAADGAPSTASDAGLTVERRFSSADAHPYEQVAWERRDAVISSGSGETVFEARGVEYPKAWSQLATNVVTSKYFRRNSESGAGESSLRQLIDRVAGTVARWGLEDGYFATPADAEAFEQELRHLVLHQRVSFNSPVWFNCGIDERPQVSACFINSVDDSMASILELARTEGMLFKHGSGTGTNLSSIRSSKELIRKGGAASGPVNFMRGYDAFAGVIKSGGTQRKAAKMVILNDDHPDVMEFIESKEHEERKAWALIDAGYDGSFNGEAYGSVYYQNANHSVRVSDEFMRAAIEGAEWETRAVTDGTVMDRLPAADMMRAIARGTHVCGDPGMQFDTTINRWNTCATTGRINASNPCSEFMFLDDSACNLASLNLMGFVREDGEFDTDEFRHAVEITFLAQEIYVDRASYPTDAIGATSRRFRPLGIGYANLGALLMSRGLAYDSEQGRDYAAAITALMTGCAYEMSARVARERGPFEAYPENREPFLRVMRQHRAALSGIHTVNVPLELMAAAQRAWDRALADGEKYGYRNAQASLLAPTGTIAFMMDCDTTGIEPDLALVKYKRLVGGGNLKIVNRTVEQALERLGYDAASIRQILSYIDEKDTIEGAPGLRARDLPVFDCAFKPLNGERFISYMGHLRMMAAVQPFLSGAISKTVNMPEEATVEEIEQAYVDAWRMGLKAVAIYRDNSKRTQPLSLEKEETASKETEVEVATPDDDAETALAPYRRRLPDERQAITHKFSIAGHDGYITVGMFEDGSPGELFIVMAKQGSVVSGLMDSFATAISMTLQYGVPLPVLVDKFAHTRFEPSGFTKNPEIPMAKSIMDYIFRWLERRFMKAPVQQQLPLEAAVPQARPALPETLEPESAPTDNAGRLFFLNQQDSPACPDCGSITVRSGSCHKCMNCGATTGCS